MTTLLLLAMAVPTHAQQVVNGDFETGDTTGWTDDSFVDPLGFGIIDYMMLYLNWSATTASERRGAYGGWFSFPSSEPWAVADIYSDPFVVTHTELSWASIDDPAASFSFPLRVTAGTTRLDTHLPGPASTDALDNWFIDTSSICGATAQVEISEADSNGPGYLDFYFDDVALTGATCPEFVDVDGDGLCARGTDLDGDGECTAVDEVTDTPQDCDDADAAIGLCLEILPTEPTWELPDSFKIVVEHAIPLETIHVVASKQEGQRCPARLQGACLGLDAPLHAAGSAVADGNGVAVIDVVPPPGLDPLGTEVFLQAVAERGPLSVVSQVVQATTVPATEEPPQTEGVVNGDFERGTVGWSMITDGWGPYFDLPCTTGVQTATTDRGESLDAEVPSVWCEAIVRSWPFTVTHHNLGYAEVGEGALTVIDGSTESSVGLSGTTVVVDGWTEHALDASSLCGQTVWLEAGWESYGTDSYVDDVHLSGPVCAELLDDDGDGLCDAGVDLDGDGTCLGADEHGQQSPPFEALQVVFADHEDGTAEGWDGEVVTWSEVDAAYPARGDHGMFLSGPPFPLHIWDPVSAPLVTHDTLQLALMYAGTGDYLYQDPWFIWYTSISGDGAYLRPTELLWPGVWHPVTFPFDAHCGELLTQLWIQDFSNTLADVMGGDNFESWYVDDLGLTGDACPIFVDYDADGACSEGLDLDGDGLCVGDGEPTPSVIQDANEPLP